MSSGRLRGPSADDPEEGDEQLIRLIRAARIAERIEVQSYSESSRGMRSWVVGWAIGTSVFVTGAVLAGSWKYSNDLSVLTTKMDYVQQRQLEQTQTIKELTEKVDQIQRPGGP